MALPKRTADAPSASPWVLFTIKVLLMLLILFTLPKLVFGDGRSARRSNANRSSRTITAVKATCAKMICDHLINEEIMNCINACVSPACFQQVVGKSPLEDGEIDVTRARDFERCTNEEFRLANKRARQEEKKQ